MNYSKLDELCREVIDCPHITPVWLDNGIRVIRNFNLQNGYLDFSKGSFVDELTYAARTKRAVPKENDIVISREAPMGTVAIIPENLKCCLGQRLVLLKIDTNKCEPYYMLYSLMSKYVQTQIGRIDDTGSIVSNLNIPDLKELEIPIPSMNEQVNISKVLKILDQKIQNNKKILSELEDMAKTMYMHLFFRKTPTGKLADIIIENGKSNVQVRDAKGLQGEYPFFTSGVSIYEWNEALVDGRNCFLNTGGNADVKFYVGKSAYSTDTWCITAKDNLADYLYMMLNTIKIELNQKFFKGTGLKHLQKDLLRERKIYIPSEDELKEFNSVIVTSFDTISKKTRENQELAALRDWLLPMLMNGQAVVE